MEGWGEKWHCSLNDLEPMSLSQRQTAPKPFRIKLGQILREREREGEHTNEEGRIRRIRRERRGS